MNAYINSKVAASRLGLTQEQLAERGPAEGIVTGNLARVPNASINAQRLASKDCKALFLLVGARGFEPPTT